MTFIETPFYIHSAPARYRQIDQEKSVSRVLARSCGTSSLAEGTHRGVFFLTEAPLLFDEGLAYAAAGR